ncbi:hypothetical protein ACFSX9_05725 [Flavobacterium ardleyense]|uniref:Integral membrane protein n=1 Tax=Flavobacterium ardleyense TaxID=2038737 RepID=A0ABW5Z639_9FLAO
MIKFDKNIPETIATAFMLVQFVSLLFFKEVNSSSIIYDTCLLITFELILLMASVFLSALYKNFWGLLFCGFGFSLFFYYFYHEMTNPKAIQETIYAFLFTHLIGLVSSLYSYFKSRKKRKIDEPLVQTMNYAIKLVIYFFLLFFVIVTVNILPEGVLTVAYLAEIDYVGFINDRGHSGSGLVADPHITLWLGIIYYFFLTSIHISQVLLGENSILDIIFIVYKKLFRTKYKSLK